MKKGEVYLIPSALSECSVNKYLPSYNLECIRSLEYFIVENARTARRFIKQVWPEAKISDLCIFELDKHDPHKNLEHYLKILKSGKDVGVLSEAGCPAIADPGALVVEWAHKNGHRVHPLVGPSSIMLGLMASGFNGQSFRFHGYLPFDKSEKCKCFKQMEKYIMKNDETQIFIETPYRNIKLIEDICHNFSGHFKLCVGMDLTDERFECVYSLSIEEWKRKDLKFLHKRPAIFLLYK